MTALAPNASDGERVPDPARELVRFAESMIGVDTLDGVITTLADHLSELLHVKGAGLLLRLPGEQRDRLSVATANTDIGARVEELEEQFGEGPCVDALCSGEQVAVPDLELELERYEKFAPAALELGVRAVHAMPMRVEGQAIGVMNIVGVQPTVLTPAQVRAGQMLTDVAVSYIINAQALAEASSLARQLQAALDSRIVIEQAKGKLSERHDVTVDEAFQRLRDHARGGRRKLGDLAAEVLRGEVDPFAD